MIPHAVGFQKMRNFVIKDAITLKKKIDMVQSLSDIEIAKRVLSRPTEIVKNPIDEHYEQLKCELLPVDMKGEEAEMIKVTLEPDEAMKKSQTNASTLLSQTYVKTSHAPTHTAWSLDVEDILAVGREGEEQR